MNQNINEVLKDKELDLRFPNRIESISVTPNEIIAELKDHRKLSIPRAWLDRPDYSNFNHATDEQLKDYEIIGLGKTVYFPQVEEYLGVHTFTGGLNSLCT
ncbi:MAG: hypothetical protein AD073_000020 [Mycoplasmataceae bacterium]|nr:MAG: hypothetical protein AD073_000020 [Mycoplasmataceae bacterium]